jgi:hypothetical protein
MKIKIKGLGVFNKHFDELRVCPSWDTYTSSNRKKEIFVRVDNMIWLGCESHKLKIFDEKIVEINIEIKEVKE